MAKKIYTIMGIIGIVLFMLILAGSISFYSGGNISQSITSQKVKEPTSLSSISSSFRYFKMVDRNTIYTASGDCKYNKEGLTSQDNCLYFIKYYPILILDTKKLSKTIGCNDLLISQFNKEVQFNLFAVRTGMNKKEIFSFYDPEEQLEVYVWCNTADNLLFGTTSPKVVDAYHNFFNLNYRRAFYGEQ